MDLSERLDALRGVPAFAGLDEAELSALAEAARAREFAVGDRLIRQGDPGDALWIIEAGAAEVRLIHSGGTRVLASVVAGDVVGEMALVTGAPRNADVVATSAGVALILARDDFERIAALHPEVVAVLTELVAGRLGRAAQDGLGDKVLEGYRIIRPVGRGATAVVYEATAMATGRRTALKMLSHRFSRDRAAMASFEREATMLERVAHPSIAASYGRFSAYGTRFLAIEFVDGVSGHDVVRLLGRMPVADALAVAGAVADALVHVHDRGVVHGDVKPANVMLDRDGRVLLTDFGIASRVDGTDQQARVAGTPRYMAPEMFVGSRPSASTDIYALGCVLYELLEGRPPFLARDIGSLVLAKRRFERPRADEMRAEVSSSVRECIGRLLDPDPTQRPSTTAALGLKPRSVTPSMVESVMQLRAAE
ncbi:MAG: protein kinase [Planctomycetes bacterium]|nr:protein kinase [Planctomycetota bacterium]